MSRPNSAPSLLGVPPPLMTMPAAYGPGGFAPAAGPLPRGVLSPPGSFNGLVHTTTRSGQESPSVPNVMIRAEPGEVVLEITKLLDMPMQQRLFGSDFKQYRVRAYADHDGLRDREVGRTGELAGHPETFIQTEDRDLETLALGPEGILRLPTASPIIHLQVEYAGGFTGNKPIGRCHISRNDQRSNSIWKYQLNGKDGAPAGCGIELRVIDGGWPMIPGLHAHSFAVEDIGQDIDPTFTTIGPMDLYPPQVFAPRPFPPARGAQPSFHTMDPAQMPQGPPQTIPPGAMQPSYHTIDPNQLGPQPSPGWKTMPHMAGVPAGPPGSFGQPLPPPGGSFNDGPIAFALVEVDSIKDIPAPVDGGPGVLQLTLERAMAPGVPIGQPVAVKMEGRDTGKLRQARNMGARLVAPVTVQDLANGAAELRVVASYQGNTGSSGFLGMGSTKGMPPSLIGRTAVMPVSFNPCPSAYMAFEDQAQRPVGGAVAKYRLCQEKDLQRTTTPGPRSPRKSGPPAQGQNDKNERSGKWQPGTFGDTEEAAALAIESQNRALVQRIKLAKHYATEASNPADQTRATLEWEQPNGYRDWADMDSVFVTMGANYVANSSAMGANVCRVYEDDTSVWEELKRKESKALQAQGKVPQDEHITKNLIQTMIKQDPNDVQKTLRPVISKDVSTIDRATLSSNRALPVLRVKVISATNVRARADHPKVVIEIPGKNGSRWTTSAAQDASNGNLYWNEQGVIKGYTYGDDLKVMLVDANWVGFDNPVASTRMRGTDFYPNEWNSGLRIDDGRGNLQMAPTVNLSIKVEKNVSNWPPNPHMYAPIDNLNLSDQQTQQLANWDVHQNAKIPFADANPNYQINEDIWGAVADSRIIEASVLLEKDPKHNQPRVKDNCPIA